MTCVFEVESEKREVAMPRRPDPIKQPLRWTQPSRKVPEARMRLTVAEGDLMAEELALLDREKPGWKAEVFGTVLEAMAALQDGMPEDVVRVAFETPIAEEAISAWRARNG